MNNWEKCYSRNGCPYYLNYKTMKSQWEHPYFAQVLVEAADYNDVIYAAYRTALKLLHIRNNHHLQSLDVDKIACAFSEILPLHGIRVDEYLTLTQLEEAVCRLYMYCDTSLSRQVWTGAMSSCLLYFFDGKKKGTVNVLSVLVLLTTLCSDKLSTKYSFLFQCLNQHDLVGAQDISHLKKIVYTILTRLQEDKAYKNAYEGNGTTMTRDMFLKWLLTEPKFIVWLSTLHRVHAAVSVRHVAIKCYRCRNTPIVGLRYRCLQCFNVDLCFQCFTRIPAYGKHDKSHAIEEYCVPSKKSQDVRAFIAKLCNNVKKKSKHSTSVESEFDLTARRQPATVWHDPKLSQLTDCQTCTNHDVMNDACGAADVCASVHSPSADRRSRSSSRGSAVDGYHSLTRSQKAREDNPQQVHYDRYSQSLPRRSKLRGSTVQSPERANKIEIPSTQVGNPSSGRYRSPDRKILPAYSSTPYRTGNSIRTPGVAQYSAVYQPDHSRDIYPTDSETLELDFYSSSTRQAVPYNPCSRSYPVGYRSTSSKSAYSQGGRSSKHNNICSEDEGIVLNSESDSSVSQFTTYDNREHYRVPGHPALPAYNDTYNRKYNSSSNQSSQVKSSKSAFDYTRHSWNSTCGTLTHNSTVYTGDAHGTLTKHGYSKMVNDSRKNSDMTTTYINGLTRAVDGVHIAVGPIIRAYQV